MTEQIKSDSPDPSVYSPEQAWDMMAYATMPPADTDTGHAAMHDTMTVNPVPNPAEAQNSLSDQTEQLDDREKLRDLVHNAKFFVHTTTPPIYHLPDGTGLWGIYPNAGYKSLGNIPADRDTVASFSQNYATWAKMRQKYGYERGNSETRELEQAFAASGVDETLTITRPTAVRYNRIDPASDKAQEPLVIFTYEGSRAVEDHIGRSGMILFSLCLPQSQAETFETEVTANPQLIRETVDIVMLDELGVDAWKGIIGGDNLAIRTDFTQGPDESKIVPFAAAPSS